MDNVLQWHVTDTNVTCHTYEWVMSHICTNQVTHMNESHHTYEWVMSDIWTRVMYPFLKHVFTLRVMYRFLKHVFILRIGFLTHVFASTWSALHHACTRWYDQPRSHMWHDSFIRVIPPRLDHVCDMTLTWSTSCHTYVAVMSHLWTSHMCECFLSVQNCTL